MNRPRPFSIPFSATVVLLAAMVAMFLVAWFPGMSVRVLDWFACTGDVAKFWTYVTYPFASWGTGNGILFLALAWLWFYWVGSSIERTDGTVGLLKSFFGYTLLASLLVAPASLAMGRPVVLAGAWLPVSALTCVWCARNPKAEIRLMAVIPVSGTILAVITAVTTVIVYGYGAPVVGLLAALPCAVGWFHGGGKFGLKSNKTVVSGRGQKAQSAKEFDEFMSQVRKREHEREERERLRKLFEDGSSEDS